MVETDVTEDLWRNIHREILLALENDNIPKSCKLTVYALSRGSIRIIVNDSDVIVRLRQSDTSDGSAFVITSNKSRNELMIHADSDHRGLVLHSGKRLSIQDFCAWLFEFACEMSRPLT